MKIIFIVLTIFIILLLINNNNIIESKIKRIKTDECKTLFKETCNCKGLKSNKTEKKDCIKTCIDANLQLFLDAECVFVKETKEGKRSSECKDYLKTKCPTCFDLDTKEEKKTCISTCFATYKTDIENEGCLPENYECKVIMDSCNCEKKDRDCRKQCKEDNKDELETLNCKKNKNK